MFDVEKNLFLFPVVPDKSVQCITVRNPANQTRVRRQWNYCIALDSAKTVKTDWTLMRLKLIWILNYQNERTPSASWRFLDLQPAVYSPNQTTAWLVHLGVNPRDLSTKTWTPNHCSLGKKQRRSKLQAFKAEKGIVKDKTSGLECPAVGAITLCSYAPVI